MADSHRRPGYGLPCQGCCAIPRAVENTVRRAMAKRLENMKEEEPELVPYYSLGTIVTSSDLSLGN